MFIPLGTPRKLNELALGCPDISVLKKKMHIAIIDDQDFGKLNPLRTHGFNLNPLGDITSIETVNSFDIVVCDIKGVGSAFGSEYEGAHVLSEIRKAYPDKYLIFFSGETFNISYLEALKTSDTSTAKDSSIDQWITVLENGLKTIGDPMQRWIRFRKSLLEKGVDIFDVFLLEQKFINSINKKDSSLLKIDNVPDEIKVLVGNFATYALKQIIEHIVEGT